MLDQLLQEIRSGGTLETHRLAARLNTSPQLVEAMLEHLERIGYLQTYVSCSSGCSGCGLSDNCNPAHRQHSAQLWQSRVKD